MMALDRPPPGIVPIRHALPEVAPDRLECGRYSGPWYVACTEWNAEALARSSCLAAGIQTFLPFVRRRQQLRDGRVRNTVEVAFPGYLFVLVAHTADWHRLKRARGIAGVLHAVGDREVPAEMPAHVMAQLLAAASQQGILEELSDPEVGLPPIEPGASVRIRTGWLAGVVGTCEWSTERRVSLLFDLVGKRLTLDRGDVEAVEA